MKNKPLPIKAGLVFTSEFEKRIDMKRKSIIIGIIGIMIILLVLLSVNLDKGETETKASNEKKQTVDIMLGNDISVTEIGSYMGSYVEDGSDEFVENVMYIVVENNGSDYIQMANININRKYEFELTTLFPGDKMLILEKNRSEYKKNLNVKKTETSNVAFFTEKPQMHTDMLEIEGDDYLINVENVSGKEFPGGKVFYKNKSGEFLLGGITYAGTIPALKKNEGVKLNANHYLRDSSEFVFVTYAE